MIHLNFYTINTLYLAYYDFVFFFPPFSSSSSSDAWRGRFQTPGGPVSLKSLLTSSIGSHLPPLQMKLGVLPWLETKRKCYMPYFSHVKWTKSHLNLLIFFCIYPDFMLVNLPVSGSVFAWVACLTVFFQTLDGLKIADTSVSFPKINTICTQYLLYPGHRTTIK